MSPAVNQSDPERVQTAIHNSVLIDGNAIGSTGVPTLVDEQPAVSHDPTELSQECINPKVKPTQVEVEDVLEEEEEDDDVTRPALMDRDGPAALSAFTKEVTAPALVAVVVSSRVGGGFNNQACMQKSNINVVSNTCLDYGCYDW